MALGLFGLNIAGLSGLAECKGGVVSTCDFFDGLQVISRQKPFKW